MNNSSLLAQNTTQFEKNIGLLENTIKSQALEFDNASVDVDSTDLFSANAVPNLINSSEAITVKSHWWGIDIILNEKLTVDIIAGTTATGSVATALGAALGAAGIVTGGIATLIGAALAAAFALKVAELKIVDNGKGVHIPITWPQWGTLLVGVPAGVAGIVAALLLFIHPLRN